MIVYLMIHDDTMGGIMASLIDDGFQVSFLSFDDSNAGGTSWWVGFLDKTSLASSLALFTMPSLVEDDFPVDVSSKGASNTGWFTCRVVSLKTIWIGNIGLWHWFIKCKCFSTFAQ